MPIVRWIDPHEKTKSACIVCGHSGGNRIILEASHWHEGSSNLKVAVCDACESAYIVNADSVIVSYPSSHNVLQDPNFIYLIYHYLELCSGLGWKIHLLERLPYERFRTVLEVGCNVGVTLDYCRTNWKSDVTGLEPSAYGIRGAEALALPIINSYIHEAKDLAGKKFDFIYATEVIEHVRDPLAFLREMRDYLAESGVMLITTPSSESLRKHIPPGELLAVLSPGAHYFLLSPRKLEALGREAGFAHCEVEIFGNTNVCVLSSVRVSRRPDLDIYGRLKLYYQNKISLWSDDERVALGHFLNYYIFSVKSGESIDEIDTLSAIDERLLRLFDFSSAVTLAFAERVVAARSIFDLGRIMPYSLPFYLFERAKRTSSVNSEGLRLYALVGVIAARGLQLDFQNLFLYHDLLQNTLREISRIQSNHVDRDPDLTTGALLQILKMIQAMVPELSAGAPSKLTKFMRKLVSMKRRFQRYHL